MRSSWKAKPKLFSLAPPRFPLSGRSGYFVSDQIGKSFSIHNGRRRLVLTVRETFLGLRGALLVPTKRWGPSIHFRPSKSSPKKKK